MKINFFAVSGFSRGGISFWKASSPSRPPSPERECVCVERDADFVYQIYNMLKFGARIRKGLGSSKFYIELCIQNYRRYLGFYSTGED